METKTSKHIFGQTPPQPWIKNEASWGVFVTNKVTEIRKITKTEDWFHVTGELNSADLPFSVDHLQKSKWWEGPSWLVKKSEHDVSKELKKGAVVLVNHSEEEILIRWLKR